jgi:hypothetical protein
MNRAQVPVFPHPPEKWTYGKVSPGIRIPYLCQDNPGQVIRTKPVAPDPAAVGQARVEKTKDTVLPVFDPGVDIVDRGGDLISKHLAAQPALFAPGIFFCHFHPYRFGLEHEKLPVSLPFLFQLYLMGVQILRGWMRSTSRETATVTERRGILS